MAGGSVITDAGGKVGHPAIHRRFDNRLAELPLRMFQRRFGYADPALAAAGGGGGIQGGIDVLKVFSRDGILRQASATASLAGGLALLRLRFRHLRTGFRQLRTGVQHRDAIGVSSMVNNTSPALTRWLSVTFNCRILPET